MRLFSSFVWLPFLFLFPLTGTGQRVGNLSSEKGNPGVVQETERRNDGNISFYLAGSGTEENPYLVGSVSDLSKIARESVDFEGVYFRQTGHIDMEKESEGGFIGTFYNRSLPFKGHYDGGGFEIRNLVIDFLPNKFIDGISSIYLGLFGRLGSGASLRNIILDSSCKILIDKWELQICANNYELYSPGFSTCYVYVGPVVAYAEEGASVSNCHSRARIAFNAKAGLDRTFPLRQFNFHIGGVAGYSQGDVYASSFAGSIYIFDSIRMYFTPVFYTGGVVGEAASVMACRNTGTISYSVNSGSIGGSSDNTVGGVAGRAREARYCYNTASIGIYAKNHFYTGGILGSGNVVRHCYNRGTIFDPEFPDGNSATYSAGIVGVGYDGFFDPVDAVSCVYNTGDIEADGKDGWTSGGTAAHITSCKDHEKVEIDTAYYLQSAQLRGTNRIEDGQSLSAAELSSEEILRQLQKGCSFWKSGTGEDGEEFPWLDLRCTVRFEEGLDQTKEMLVPAYTCLDYKSERPGYEFAGWFTDEARTKPWDFSYPVTQDMTLYAAYVSVEWTAHAASAFAGGDGSAEAPYLIETPEQLALLAKQAREQNYVTRGKHYRLQADLDLASIAAEPDIPAEWVPIGAGPDSLAFRGCFDGNGHKIANLVQSKPVSFYGFESSKDKPVYRGLFGVATGADIRNLSLENVSISQRSPEKNVPIEAINHYEIPPFSLSAASLIGRADSCSISACSVQGFIRIDDPSVYYSFNSSAYTYDVCLGGLVGTALSCRITDSRADMVFSVRDTLSRSMVSGQSLSLGVCAGGLISWGQENYLENIFCHSMQTSVASRPDGYGSYDYEPIFVGGGIVGFSRSDTLFLVASEGNTHARK